MASHSSNSKANTVGSTNKRRVSYFYDAEVGNYHYGQGHPMKPHRARLTHNLVVNYGLFRQMDIFRPTLMPASDLTRFHSDDYINFLRLITPDNMSDYTRQLQKFNFCQIYCSGSMGGAARLNQKAADIVINWAELLKCHDRVLYIDIDIHHGDGVEEAFYTTNRVMTCSFHKFGEFFPGTGAVQDLGAGGGEGYAINYPLNDGMDDESFDSLSGDRLGCFNLSLRGHADCVAFTAILLDTPYFGPDYRLHLPVSNMQNLNSRTYLDNMTNNVLEILNKVEIAPSVPILTGQDGTTQIPGIFGEGQEEDSDANTNMNVVGAE
eukprot:GSChrysophyteH1.ASY1.ANO1.276.1 assembled CDS